MTYQIKDIDDLTVLKESLLWWNTISIVEKMESTGNYLTSDDVNNRTNEQIVYMWKCRQNKQRTL